MLILVSFVVSPSLLFLNMCKRRRYIFSRVYRISFFLQGTVSGVEIDLGDGRLYATLVIPKDEAASYGVKGSTESGAEDPGTYNPELFRLFFPQVRLLPSSIFL